MKLRKVFALIVLWQRWKLWISVKDRLPEDKAEILIFDDYAKHISIGYKTNNLFFDLIDFTMTPANVSHWMPLPDQPKE